MKLHYYKPEDGVSNFGDELNKSIWEHFFPNFFNEDVNTVFFGIGTILRAAKKQYPTSEIIVFGSGAHAGSQTNETNFNVNFVRGPLSAKAMGLEDSQFITDPAILTPLVHPVQKKDKKHQVSYMPHFSVANDNYQALFESIGVHYIDPRDSIPSILARMNASELILTEAMHGAIVADAYRVPWLPLASYTSFNRFKWQDWSESLGMNVEINSFPRLYPQDKGVKLFFKKRKARAIIKKVLKQQPYLSSNTQSDEARSEILKRIELFKQTYIHQS